MDNTRLVVTRFAADKKRGAGYLQDGWQYELFGTSLEPVAWPAPETVELYYGRCGQENRFAQVMAELGIDKLFCTELGGHWLVVLVGLFTWNLRTILGAERAGPLVPSAVAPEPRCEVVPVSEQQPEIVEICALAQAEPPPTLEPQPQSEPPLMAQPPTSETATPRSDLLARLGGLNWSAVEARNPGWKWLPKQGLLCPVGKLVSPYKLRVPSSGTPMLVLRTRHRDCRDCPQRAQCFDGAQRQLWQRERVRIANGHGRSCAPAASTRQAPPGSPAAAQALVQRLRRRTHAVKLAFFRHVDMEFPPSAEFIRPERR